MSEHVGATLNVLRHYYGKVQDGKTYPHELNDVQIAVYLRALAPFEPDELQAASEKWMDSSRWFPKASDLLDILRPPVSTAALAHLAWASVESAIARGGAYRGAYFQQGAIGECVRQVFGTWAIACSFDLDSPGWAIRRQSFLAIFPTLLNRDCGSVTLRGLHGNLEPYNVPLVRGLPEPDVDQLAEGDLSPRDAKALVAEIRSRFELKPKETP